MIYSVPVKSIVMGNKIILTGIFLLALSTVAFAGITELLHKASYGECTLTVMHDAVPGEKGVIVLRPGNRAGSACKLARPQAAEVLDKALQKYESSNDLAEITSVFLGGRLISYPWISEYLVNVSENNPGWNRATGKPEQSSINQYVNNILYTNDILAPFSQALQNHGYKITGISCEKILVNKDKLPYDALCWILIK